MVTLLGRLTGGAIIFLGLDKEDTEEMRMPELEADRIWKKFDFGSRVCHILRLNVIKGLDIIPVLTSVQL